MFKNFGSGVGLRSAHYSQFLKTPPTSVRWVEVISENFMRWENGLLPSRPVKTLEQVRSQFPVHLHGVSLSLGSADDLNFNYLKRLKELVDRIEPEIVSDHLCWTGVDGENLHDLLPLPYTQSTIDWLVGKILRVQDFLGRRILIENLSTYLEYSSSEMPEWEFLSEIAKKADCGLLLDLNNVYVSSVNHGFNPLDYLRSLPTERVGQIHLAGHRVEADGLLIDTHDAPVCDDVWTLYEWYVENHPSVSTMIERDGNIPDWEELETEILKIQKITERAHARINARVATATI
jgi:uncharacterized protein (UPF0276 family)